jgi:hypothetical protein
MSPEVAALVARLRERGVCAAVAAPYGAANVCVLGKSHGAPGSHLKLHQDREGRKFGRSGYVAPRPEQ